MPPNFSKSSKNFAALCCGLSLLALSTWRAHAQWAYPYDPAWTRSFRAGVLVGFNISADFTMKGNFGVSSGGAGVFDDGYVRRDAGGALTSDWGYNSAAQYNSTTETLTMHKTTAFNTSSAASVSDPAELGVDLAYGGILWHGERVRVGWELGFGFLPIKISDNSTLRAAVTRQAYTFDASGIVIPPAGYQGTPNSSGPVISSAPTGTPTTETLNNILVTGSRTLDVNFYALKLGPSIFVDITHWLGFSASIGPAVGIVSGDLNYNETINYSSGTSQSFGRVSNTDLTYGGYVNAMFTFHTVKNGDFYLGAQYMPMGRVSIGGANRQADLNLRGQVYVMAGINWPF